MGKFPDTDIWRLLDNNRNSQNYGKNYIFDFSEFSSDEIKETIKNYIWLNYSTGNRVPKGLKETMRRLYVFAAFCRERGIQSLAELDNSLMDDYRTFLRLYRSPATKNVFSYVSQRNCFSALKTLIGWCHAFMPEAVPEKQIFTGNEYRQNYSKVKIEFIPDEIMKMVNDALEKENNPFLKYGIRIMESTGMRIGDLLLLQTDCISEHPVSGYVISWYDHKNHKSMDNLPIPALCKDAVRQLLDITAVYRDKAEDSDKKHLFIYKPQRGRNRTPIVTISKQVFTKWCSEFSKRHSIRDSEGNLFRITTHMFRRTLATDMLSKGTNLKVIQTVLGHSSPATTKKYYADVKDTSCADIFRHIGILGNIAQIEKDHLRNPSELQWFQENCTGKARLSDGYCTLPIQNGKPCGRFLSQQKCYLCSRYVTTLDDLETHRRHLAELREMLDNNIYGEHFAAHILPTIAVLKEIICRLEELKNEQ